MGDYCYLDDCRDGVGVCTDVVLRDGEVMVLIYT